METWWNEQNQDEVYLICTFDWAGEGYIMPFATEVDGYYGDFGNGYVPYFAVIGAYNILMYGENVYVDAIATIPDAVDSFNYMGVVNPIADYMIEFGDEFTVDISNTFIHPEGENFTVTIDGISNTEVLEATLDGTTLTVTAQSVMDIAEITLLATADDGMSATHSFEVSVVDPSLTPVHFNLFDSYGDGWGFSGLINYITLGDQQITLESGTDGTVIVFLNAGDYAYTYTAADNYGDENSWTITLADGTELGSGAGGANGTTDYTFTVPAASTGTISGAVTLAGEGDVTAVEVTIGGDTVSPDASGNYSVALNTGTYTLTATLEGYDDYVMADVTVTEGQITTVDFEMIEALGADSDVVLVNKLIGNYPNPFNPTTTISYTLATDGNVMIDVYNSRGQKVNTLINEFTTAGNHSVVWNGKDSRNHGLASGIYFYKINSGRFTSTKKMILLK